MISPYPALSPLCSANLLQVKQYLLYILILGSVKMPYQRVAFILDDL